MTATISTQQSNLPLHTCPTTSKHAILDLPIMAEPVHSPEDPIVCNFSSWILQPWTPVSKSVTSTVQLITGYYKTGSQKLDSTGSGDLCIYCICPKPAQQALTKPALLYLSSNIQTSPYCINPGSSKPGPPLLKPDSPFTTTTLHTLSRTTGNICLCVTKDMK